MIRVFSRRLLILLAPLFATCLSIFGFQIVFADYNIPSIENDSPAINSGYNNSTSSEFTPHTGVGNDAFDGQYTWAKVYVPIGTATTVSVTHLCDSGYTLNNSNVEFHLKSMTRNEDLGGSGLPAPSARVDRVGARNQSQCADVDFNISNTDGIASTRSGHSGYRVFALWAKMTSPTGVGVSAERYFRFRSSSPGTRVGLADGADFLGAIESTNAYYSIYNKSGDWNYAVMFAPKQAPTCGSASSFTAIIGFYDPDNGLYQPNMHVNLYSSDRHSPSINWTLEKQWTAVQVQNGPWGASGTRSNLTWGGYDRNKIYKLVIVGSRSPNTVQIKLPFDQLDADTSLYPPCPGPGWQLADAGSLIVRNDGRNMGQNTGNFGNPDDTDAPQPTQSFRFIHNVRNNGTREITNSKWNYDCSTLGKTGVVCGTAPSGATRYYRKLGTTPNTQNIIFDKCWTEDISTTLSGCATHANLSIGSSFAGLSHNPFQYYSPPGGKGGTGYLQAPDWDWSWRSVTIGSDDGGKSKCLLGSFYPYKGIPNTTAGVGTTSWSITGSSGDRVQLPSLCVNVPFYYNLTPQLALSGGGTAQQGDTVTASTLGIENPARSNSPVAGRNHTNSEAGPVKGVVELRVPSGTAEPVDKVLQNHIAQDPCSYMKSKVSGPSDCDDSIGRTGAGIAAQNGVTALLAGGTIRDSAFTSNMPVGTKLCYAVYAQHPRNTDSSDVGAAGNAYWSYSSIQCQAIVKAPKVQFNNTDVTVGRYRTTNNGCQNAANAPIITVGSPSVKSPSNLYGSWVEYGAFATSDITNFGSGAVPFGIASQPHRLTFGNNNFTIPANNLGSFVYSKNCLANPFGIVKDGDNTDLVALADDTVFDRSTGVLDLQKLDPAKDKTGYFAINKSIQIGLTGSPAPGPRPSTDTFSVTVNVEAWAREMRGGDCSKQPGGVSPIAVVLNNDIAKRKTTNIICSSDKNDMKSYAFTFELTDSEKIENIIIGLGSQYDAYVELDIGAVSVVINKNNVPAATGFTTPFPTRTDFGMFDSSSLGFVGVGGKSCRFVDSKPFTIRRGGGGSPCVGIDTNDSMLVTSNALLANLRQPSASASVPPPLDSNYTGFNGRTIVVYSKKTDPGNCSSTSSGNITINKDVIFQRTGFNSILDVPRLMFIADCSITIDDNVSEVNASLIAGDAIKTCSAVAKTQDKCNNRLTLRGAISANRLLLWRTYGADISPSGAAAQDPSLPAEMFDLSPSQVVSGYSRGARSSAPTTVYEVDLPPRY